MSSWQRFWGWEAAGGRRKRWRLAKKYIYNNPHTSQTRSPEHARSPALLAPLALLAAADGVPEKQGVGFLLPGAEKLLNLLGSYIRL